MTDTQGAFRAGHPLGQSRQRIGLRVDERADVGRLAHRERALPTVREETVGRVGVGVMLGRVERVRTAQRLREAVVPEDVEALPPAGSGRGAVANHDVAAAQQRPSASNFDRRRRTAFGFLRTRRAISLWRCPSQRA